MKFIGLFSLGVLAVFILSALLERDITAETVSSVDSRTHTAPAFATPH